MTRLSEEKLCLLEASPLTAAEKVLCAEIRALQRNLAEQWRVQKGLERERDGARAALEDRDKMHEAYVQQLQAERLRAIAERDDLKYLLTEINKHVMPGEMDSVESLRGIIRDRDRMRERVKRLRDALSACAPSWLPPVIRDKRRDALAPEDEMAKEST